MPHKCFYFYSKVLDTAFYRDSLCFFIYFYIQIYFIIVVLIQHNFINYNRKKNFYWTKYTLIIMHFVYIYIYYLFIFDSFMIRLKPSNCFYKKLLLFFLHFLLCWPCLHLLHANWKLEDQMMFHHFTSSKAESSYQARLIYGNNNNKIMRRREK